MPLLVGEGRRLTRPPGRRRRGTDIRGSTLSPAAEPPPRRLAHLVGRSMAARIVVLPVAALAGFLAIRLVISDVGTRGFAVYALVAGVAALLPVADLGIGAAVTDAAARRREIGSSEYRGVLVTSLRTLAASAACVAIAGWTGAAFGLWGSVFGLGTSRTVDLGVALVATLVAVNLPMSIGARLLIGSGANHTVVVVKGLAPVFALVVLGTMIALGSPAWVLPGAPFAGHVITSVLALHLARRAGLIRLGALLRAAASRSAATSPIRMYALPMFVIQATLPLTFQTDRVVLTWVGSLDAVAQYSLVAPLYVASYSVVAASSGAMWAHFSSTRSQVRPTRAAMGRLVAGFAAVGLVLGLGIVGAGPWVVTFMAGDPDAVPRLVYVAFAAALVAAAMWLPFGTLYTDPNGLRFQAIGFSAMAVVNLAAALALALVLGPAGPPLATVVALTTALIVPGVLRFRRLSATPDKVVERAS